MDWNQVLADPCLRDLPYKIELNREGQIVMSPASNRHASLQFRLGHFLANHLGGARGVFTECSVMTVEGVRVPDVAWASPGFIQRHGDETPFSAAPELCAEIVSPSNTESQMAAKVALYLAAGAQEVWLVAETGAVSFHGPEGPRARSSFPGIPQQIEF